MPSPIMSEPPSEPLPENPTWSELKLPELLMSDTIRSLHAIIDNEGDALQRTACQTAAGRALWKHVVHDPLADILAGESNLRSLHEKIRKDRLNNAREVSGVILAVRTLWFDSKIEAALRCFDGGETQVVLLGAGQVFTSVPLSMHSPCYKRANNSQRSFAHQESIPASNCIRISLVPPFSVFEHTPLSLSLSSQLHGNKIRDSNRPFFFT